MGTTVVGIKTAQGEFFPILDPAGGKKRRVVLVPSEKGQENVKIQLYLRNEQKSSEPVYLSSLFLEHIARSESGDAEIELLLSADSEQNIYATARDLVSGELKSISVAARDVGSSEYSIPSSEFDSLSGVMPLPGEEPSIPGKSETGDYSAGQEFGVGEGGKPVQQGVRPLYLAAFVLAGIFIIILIAYFILRGTQSAAPQSGPADPARALFTVLPFLPAFGRRSKPRVR